MNTAANRPNTFLNLEKRNKEKSHLHKLMTHYDTEVHNPSVIMSHVKVFNHHYISIVTRK